ncbi:MAG: transglutaminase family protein [Calditrichia bacterium]
MEKYLEPGFFMDSGHPHVIHYAREITRNIKDKKQKAIALYGAIRDGFQYDPYKLDLRPDAMKASYLLTRDYGYCIEKANLLGACARVVGIPSRLGFAIVKNHIGTAKLEKILKTDLLVFHGYTELYLNGKWLKATPAFNKELCKKLDVAPLEFDGETDSIFQEYDRQGGKFMEYIHDYGTYPDIPYDLFISELKKHYPHVFEKYDRYDEGILIIE